ncbi:MAG: hypothetical protein GQ524_01600 [Anaerolineales bacterium]|nr:hypothetical protein [Anaerolineales bacterium]
MRYSIPRSSMQVLRQAAQRMILAPRILFLALLLLSAGCAVARESPTPVVEAPPMPPPEWTLALELPSSSPGSSNSSMPSITATMPTRPASTLTPYPSGSPVVRNRAPVELTMIQMFSDSKGWGIEGASILTTFDGGRTWRDVTPPDVLPNEKRVVAFGGFLDASAGWVIFAPNEGWNEWDPSSIPSDAVVWYTSDSGRTWNHSAPLGHTLEPWSNILPSFSMVDHQKGWLRLSGSYVAAGPKKVTGYFCTTDGGATWDELSSIWCEVSGRCIASPFDESFVAPPDGSIQYSASPPGWVSEMEFFNQTGWILQDDSGCGPCYGNPPAPGYWLSVDGGSTWHEYRLPPPQAEPDLFDQYWRCYPQQLNLLSEEIIRLVVACWYERQGENPLFFGPGEAAYLYASGDGGASWETYPLPPAVEWRIKNRLTATVGEGKVRMIFVNETDGMLFGREMFRTTDAGVTWIPINTVNWDGEFSFVDPWLGWAIARNEDERALVYTEDGGETWQILNPVGWP